MKKSNETPERRLPAKLLESVLIRQVLRLVFAGGYSSFFVYLLFFARRRRHLEQRYLNPVPLVNSVDQFLRLSFAGNRSLYDYFTNFFGNLALFVPLPFFLLSFLRLKTLSGVLLASFFLSFSVEALQFICKRGVADVDDILLNVAGAWIGYVACVKLFGASADRE